MDRQPIIRRVDHLVVRVDAPEPLFAFFKDQLMLPEAWAIQTNPIFTSGGFNLGNLNLEIMKLQGKTAHLDEAQLYGMAFELEPYEISLPELEDRRIPHTPPMPFIQVDDQGWQVTTWTSVFLGGLLGETPAQRLFFPLSQRANKEVWEHGSLPAQRNRRLGLSYIYNSIFKQGVIYSTEYNSAWRAQHIHSETPHSGLDVLGVYEVTIGVSDLGKAHDCWLALLDPYPEIAPDVWELPDGLHIHLVENPRNALLGMIWQVASLNRAAQHLHKRSLLGEETSQGIQIDPQKMYNLSVRLIQ